MRPWLKNAAKARGPGVGAWQASGKAQYWRQLALDIEADSLLRQRADHDLDVVISLFKRLEVWSERNPSAPGQQFLDELEAQQVASDSVAALGARPQGVSVLTVAACAGRQRRGLRGLGNDVARVLHPLETGSFTHGLQQVLGVDPAR